MEKLSQNSTISFKDELHARPYIKLSNNLRTFHFAYLLKENDENKSWAYLDKFLGKINFQKLPKEVSKYWVAEGKDLIIRYECHTEFISLTLIYPNKIEDDNKNKPKLFDKIFFIMIILLVQTLQKMVQMYLCLSNQTEQIFLDLVLEEYLYKTKI